MAMNPNLECVDGLEPGLGVDITTDPDCQSVGAGIDYDPPGTYADLAEVLADPCFAIAAGGCTTDGKPYLGSRPPGRIIASGIEGSTEIGPYVMSDTALGGGIAYAPILSVPIDLPCAADVQVLANFAALGNEMSDNTPYATGPPRAILQARVNVGPWTDLYFTQYARGMVTGTDPWDVTVDSVPALWPIPLPAGLTTIDFRVVYEKNESPSSTAQLLSESKGAYWTAYST